MNLRAGLEKVKYDIRMQELNVRNGSITAEELKKQLSQLPDSKDNSEEFKVEVGFEAPSEN
ncbi:MAG: hypothetical protein AABZ31_01830 [Bdellovibrionota bacterium]